MSIYQVRLCRVLNLGKVKPRKAFEALRGFLGFFLAETYRSRTYRRRLSLPPVLKTGRHTGDDTPPHDSHICDTKPGGKQVRPAARRRGRERDFPVSPALPIARREKRLILFLIPDRCRLTPCRRSEYLDCLAQTGAPSAQRFTAL